MRRLFIVLAKLIGLIQIFWGVAYLASFNLMIYEIAGMESTSANQINIQMFGLLVSTLISFGMAWALLLRADWIADKIGIQSNEQNLLFSDEVILLCGIKVVGLYLLSNSIPSLITSTIDSSIYSRWSAGSVPLFVHSLPSVVKIVVALLFVIRTQFVLHLVAKGEKADGKRILIWGLVLLVLLVGLGRILVNPIGLQRYGGNSVVGESSAYVSKPQFIARRDTNNTSVQNWNPLPYGQNSLSTNAPPNLSTATLVEVIEYLKEKTDHATTSDRVK
jgi:hypothetical protein